MFSSPFLVPFCVKYDKCCPANVPIPRCPIHTTNILKNSATARDFNHAYFKPPKPKIGHPMAALHPSINEPRWAGFGSRTPHPMN